MGAKAPGKVFDYRIVKRFSFRSHNKKLGKGIKLRLRLYLTEFLYSDV